MRLSLGGSPNVISKEQWLAYIQAGQAFAMGINLGPVAAQFTYLQLWNPGSKTLLVRQILCELAVGGEISLKTDGASRATNLGNGVNLLVNSGASTAEVHSENNAGSIGTLFARQSILANVQTWWDGDWIAVIPPNQGVDVVPINVNVGAYATFLWAEI
jgi:hypothetical protein